MNGELYPGEFEAMERQGRLDAVIQEQKMMTREEAIEELSILLNKYQDGHFGDAIDMAMTALEQEPKTGHWIVLSATDMYCSECNEVEHLDTSRKFCAYCGTKMSENPTGLESEEQA